MSDDPVVKMYAAEAALMETREELEKVRRENDELRNQMAVNNLTKASEKFSIVSSFLVKFS